MSNGTDDQPAIYPLGEGGAELGMTRGEIQEHVDWLWGYQQVQTEFAIEMIFAWLVAMTFIARRLSTKQFVVAHVFYLAFLLRQYMQIENSLNALFIWQVRNGLPPLDLNASLITGFYWEYLSGYIDQVMFSAAVAGSIWWSISCRRTDASLRDASASG